MAQFVINAKERRQAFWKFLVFFLVAVSLILLAAYFDTMIPSKDNKNMRAQLATYKLQEQAQDRFTGLTEEAKMLIDSLTRPGANIEYINTQINEKIRQMANLQYKDSSLYSRLNNSVVDALHRYHEAVDKIARMGDLPDKFQKTTAELNITKMNLLDCQTKLSNVLNAQQP